MFTQFRTGYFNFIEWRTKELYPTTYHVINLKNDSQPKYVDIKFSR